MYKDKIVDEFDVTYKLPKTTIDKISLASEFIFISRTIINEELNEYWPHKNGGDRYMAYKFSATDWVAPTGNMIIANKVNEVLEEVDEALNDMRVNIIETDITEKIAAFFENKTGQEVDEKGLKDFIEHSIEVSKLQTEKIVGNKKKGIVGIKEIWDEKFPKPAHCRINQPRLIRSRKVMSWSILPREAILL